MQKCAANHVIAGFFLRVKFLPYVKLCGNWYRLSPCSYSRNLEDGRKISVVLTEGYTWPIYLRTYAVRLSDIGTSRSFPNLEFRIYKIPRFKSISDTFKLGASEQRSHLPFRLYRKIPCQSPWQGKDRRSNLFRSRRRNIITPHQIHDVERRLDENVDKTKRRLQPR